VRRVGLEVSDSSRWTTPTKHGQPFKGSTNPCLAIALSLVTRHANVKATRQGVVLAADEAMIEGALEVTEITRLVDLDIRSGYLLARPRELNQFFRADIRTECWLFAFHERRLVKILVQALCPTTCV
jgi:hypothetical protein